MSKYFVIVFSAVFQSFYSRTYNMEVTEDCFKANHTAVRAAYLLAIYNLFKKV